MEVIRSCSGLIILSGEHSRASFWVAFEREIAIRAGLAVYLWDPDRNALDLDRKGRTNLSVFLSHANRDRDAALYVASHMEQRSFDVWLGSDGIVNLRDDFPDDSPMEAGMSRGGYMVVLDSRRAQGSSMVQFYIREVGNGRIVVASLDGSPAPHYFTDTDKKDQFVQLWDGTGISENRIDDLIVRLCWLMYRNQMLR